VPTIRHWRFRTTITVPVNISGGGELVARSPGRGGVYRTRDVGTSKVKFRLVALLRRRWRECVSSFARRSSHESAQSRTEGSALTPQLQGSVRTDRTPESCLRFIFVPAVLILFRSSLDLPRSNIHTPAIELTDNRPNRAAGVACRRAVLVLTPPIRPS